MNLDCTPPDDSWCAHVEDNSKYYIYHYYPCKLISIQITIRIIILFSFTLKMRISKDAYDALVLMLLTKLVPNSTIKWCCSCIKY